MLKNISQLEHKIGERVYHLLCDSNSPLNEVKDALFEFVKFIGKVEDAAKATQEEPKKDIDAESKVESLPESSEQVS